MTVLDGAVSQWNRSAIESWATCPFRYFLGYVLRVAPTTRPEDQWGIDPLERGRLVHGILRRSYSAAPGGAPTVAELGAVAEEEFGRLYAVVTDRSSARIFEVTAGEAKEVAALFTGTVVDLGEQVLMPGLINAHCHLDYTMLRRSIQQPKGFTAWVHRLNAVKRSLADEDYLEAIRKGEASLPAPTGGCASGC